MKQIQTLSEEDLDSVEFILSDIDDTLTTEGELLPETYDALWRLKRAGYKIVPVTGRPAGWCELIARWWPSEAVVGENGAFVLYMEGAVLKRVLHPSVSSVDVAGRLKEVEKAVLSGVKGSRVAKDQFARLFDLAIDFSEEPPFLDLSAAKEIKRICESFGAQAKISSIHVNTWFGDYSKLDMAVILLQSRYGYSDEALKRKVIYLGDSPNDEPMFRFFPLSIGVANIKPFLPALEAKPGYLTKEPAGKGFCEFTNILLDRKK